MKNRGMKTIALLMALLLAASPLSAMAGDASGGNGASAVSASEDLQTDENESEAPADATVSGDSSQKAEDETGAGASGKTTEEKKTESSKAQTQTETELQAESEEDSGKKTTYDLTDGSISIRFKSETTTYTYIGSEIRPEVEVVRTENGKEEILPADDFDITYQNNISAGTATVSVQGKNGEDNERQYEGVRTIEFRITQASLSACQIQVSSAGYTGKATLPTVTATYNGKQLKEGTDYTLSCSGNVKLGATATAVISGIGSFTGTVTKSFEVKPYAPTVKTKSKAYNKIKVSWNKTKGSKGYEIQRSTSPTTGFKTIKKYTSAGKKSLTKKVTCGKTYYYRVRSYAKIKVKVKVKGKTKTKTKKIYSEWSAPVAGTATLAKTKIRSASGASKTSVKIKWKKVSGAQGYEIWRSNSESGTYVQIKTTKKTSYTNKSLTTNSTWYYKVRAYRKLGNTKTYGAFSAVKKGSVKTTSAREASLMPLFPDGIPTTEAQMQKYLTTIVVKVKDGDGNDKTKTLTVHKDLASKVKSVFNELYAIGFPIKSVGCYNWRNTTGSGTRSHHSYGVAIDINPYENYMVGYTSGFYKPGENKYSVTSEVVAIWAKYGFYWGGNFTRAKDYMHFTYTGY